MIGVLKVRTHNRAVDKRRADVSCNYKLMARMFHMYSPMLTAYKTQIFLKTHVTNCGSVRSMVLKVQNKNKLGFSYFMIRVKYIAKKQESSCIFYVHYQ